jgi:hypothetical protein
MNRTEVLEEIERAFEEIRKLINDSYEMNSFNPLYFEPKFKKWFAKKMDDLEAKKT